MNCFQTDLTIHAFNPCNNPVRGVVASARCGKVAEDQKSQQLVSGEQQLKPVQLKALVFLFKNYHKMAKKKRFYLKA